MRSTDADAGTIRIRVDYDFASTLCYVAHRTMAQLARPIADLGLRLDWSPLDLTRITGWRRGAEMDDLRRANALRVAAELGVEVRVPGTWLDSRRAHAIGLALAGEAPEREAAWRERVFSGVFEEGRDLDAAGVDRLAADLGDVPDAAAIARGTDELEARTRRAHEEGVTGVPSFMLSEWPFGGIQTDDTMLSILGRFAARQREGHVA